MGYDKKKVIDIALAEVGYLEKETNAQLDSKTGNAGDENYTKYARDLAELNFYNGRKQGAAWCDVFVDWCFVQAYGKAAALALTCQPTKAANNCGAGCKYSRQYYQSKGQLHSSPQAGDQIFFYSSDKSSISHTGLVEKVDGSKVYTIEGNTSGSSGVVANGGGVFKKSYALSYARIAGYGRPAYGTQTVKEESSQTASNASQSASSTQAAEYITYTVKKGDSLWEIARKQLGNANRYKEIKTLNGLKSDNIKVGQVLKIAKKKTTSSAANYKLYTVKRGESLWTIARDQLGKAQRYKEIMTLNGMKTDLIKQGQVIKIPVK